MRYFLSFLLLNTILLSQNIYQLSDVNSNIDSNGIEMVYDKKTHKPITGILRTYVYDRIYIESTYVNGKIDGIRKQFYKSGNVFEEWYFKDGEDTGYRKTYYTNGNIFLDKTKNGVGKTYYLDGNIMSEIDFKDGKIYSYEKWYYPNGSLIDDVPYHQNKKNGIRFIYAEDGNLISQIRYENNKVKNAYWIFQSEEKREMNENEIHVLLDAISRLESNLIPLDALID